MVAAGGLLGCDGPAGSEAPPSVNEAREPQTGTRKDVLAAYYDSLLPPAWLNWTTDGSPPLECGSGSLTGGFKCRGSYCDDVNLYCRASGFTPVSSWWTDAFSEEGNNQRVCENNGYVTGIRCGGSYCDNVSLRCSQLNNGGRRNNCYWTGLLSDEDGGKFVAPQSMFVAGVRCAGRYCDNLRFYLCQADETTVPVDLDALARQYAPRLRFDQEFGTDSGAQSKCFPSDPQVYFEQRARGVAAVALCNKSASTIANNQVPAFYIAKQCGTNTVVIRYWYFYAWQSTCFGNEGEHAADWESLAVTLIDGQLARVAFYQHGGWYTRNPGHFETTGGTHPVAYVGKNSHGSYHDSGGSGGCLYFEDYRNPGSNNYRMDTWNNLVRIARGSTAPSWMNCEGDRCFDGIGHPIDQTGEPCGSGGCDKDGCDKTQLGANVPFITNPE
ncbi:MAG: hypothetical protein ACOZQL_19920 [Myxococcota bacterium]